ncbi:MAG: hypothetical protein IKL36_06330, partial [Clostridia bacterium]|nr:hypothetical protein [Clostridia bacterium]
SLRRATKKLRLLELLRAIGVPRSADRVSGLCPDNPRPFLKKVDKNATGEVLNYRLAQQAFPQQKGPCGPFLVFISFLPQGI